MNGYRRTRPLFTLLFVSALILSVGVFGNRGLNAAEVVPIDAFYGQWRGNGLAKSPDALLMGVTARDFDVVIQPSDRGFHVSWTSVIRDDGASENEVRRKSTSLEFARTDQPQVFSAVEQGDPLSGQSYAWARVAGQTLTVTLLTIDEKGSYHLQSFDRTLTGFGMDFNFTRLRDNEVSFKVNGKLTRTAN